MAVGFRLVWFKNIHHLVVVVVKVVGVVGVVGGVGVGGGVRVNPIISQPQHGVCRPEGRTQQGKNISYLVRYECTQDNQELLKGQNHKFFYL